MTIFGKLPQERAMSSLIHDLNSSQGTIGYAIEKIKEALPSDELEKVEKYLNWISESCKGISDAQDLYYTRFKNDFKVDEEGKFIIEKN